MKDYKYKSIALIAEEFENVDLHFRRELAFNDSMEILSIGFSVENGPNVILRYCKLDDDNDVRIMSSDIIENISKSKYPRMLEVCNMLSYEDDFLTYYLDRGGSVHVSYTFPVFLGDDGMGRAAVEMLWRIKESLDKWYPTLMKALYTDEDLGFFIDEQKMIAAAKAMSLAQMVNRSLQEDEADDSLEILQEEDDDLLQSMQEDEAD